MQNNRTTATTYDHSEEATSAQLKQLVDAGKDKLVEVKDKLVEAKDLVVEKAESTVSTMSKLIKAHPVAAAGIAVGIGYVALRLIRR